MTEVALRREVEELRRDNEMMRAQLDAIRTKLAPIKQQHKAQIDALTTRITALNLEVERLRGEAASSSGGGGGGGGGAEQTAELTRLRDEVARLRAYKKRQDEKRATKVQTRALNRVTMADLMASEGGDKRSTRMLNRGGANAGNQAGNRGTRMLGAQELASAGIPSGANRPGDRGTRMLGASDVARAGVPGTGNRAGDRGTRMLGAADLASAGIPGAGNRPGDRGTRMLGAADLANAGIPGSGNRAGDRGTRMLGAADLAGVPTGGSNRPGDRGTRMLGATDLARAGVPTGGSAGDRGTRLISSPARPPPPGAAVRDRSPPRGTTAGRRRSPSPPTRDGGATGTAGRRRSGRLSSEGRMINSPQDLERLKRQTRNMAGARATTSMDVEMAFMSHVTSVLEDIIKLEMEIANNGGGESEEGAAGGALDVEAQAELEEMRTKVDVATQAKAELERALKNALNKLDDIVSAVAVARQACGTNYNAKRALGDVDQIVTSLQTAIRQSQGTHDATMASQIPAINEVRRNLLAGIQAGVSLRSVDSSRKQGTLERLATLKETLMSALDQRFSAVVVDEGSASDDGDDWV